jgi:hypothetical protein
VFMLHVVMDVVRTQSGHKDKRNKFAGDRVRPIRSAAGGPAGHGRLEVIQGGRRGRVISMPGPANKRGRHHEDAVSGLDRPAG